MIFIWQRFGFLIPVIGIGSLVLIQAIVDGLFGSKTYTQSSSFYAPIAMVLAAGVTYLLGRHLIAREQPRELHDPTTGQAVILQRRSTFFFIPVAYFTYVFLAFALVGFIFGQFN